MVIIYIYIYISNHYPIYLILINCYISIDFNIFKKREYVKVLSIAQTYIKNSTYSGSCDYDYNY